MVVLEIYFAIEKDTYSDIFFASFSLFISICQIGIINLSIY